jgi:NitT/TauT family transport system substrate-binding protein
MLARMTTAQQATKVVFITNWYAQAEHGGFYQAVARHYQRQGLDVEVKMGGPQINAAAAACGSGRPGDGLDPDHQGSRTGPAECSRGHVSEGSAVLIAHPGWQTCPTQSRTLLIGQASETTFWPWLKAKYGFTDAQKRPYAFSVQQFLWTERRATRLFDFGALHHREGGDQAGCIPARRQRLSALRPDRSGYGEDVEGQPEMIRKFVQASAEGGRAI